MMRHLSVVFLATVAASTSSLSAQPAARRANLTGTVIAVNQQSDSVTVIDLKTMEAYPSRRGWESAYRSWPCELSVNPSSARGGCRR